MENLRRAGRIDFESSKVYILSVTVLRTIFFVARVLMDKHFGGKNYSAQVKPEMLLSPLAVDMVGGQI
jgi:hypothetical protein